MRSKPTRIMVLTTLLITWLGLASFVILTSNYFRIEAYATSNWMNGWGYRRQLTMDGTSISEDLTNFPVLVKLDSSFFDFTKVQDNGQDVRFTSSDGLTLLKYEIERWNKTAGKAEVWVKIPTVLSGQKTDFYIYYGNPVATDIQEPTQVWDNGFILVMHLKETSGTRYDSTTNHNNGVPYGGISKATSGKIDGVDDFDAVDDYLSVAHASSLNYGNKVTFELWLNPHGASSFNGGIDKGEGSCYVLGSPSGSGRLRLGKSGTGTLLSSTSALPTNSWSYVAALKNGTATNGLKIYINGNLDAQGTETTTCTNTTSNLQIGKRPAYNEYLNSFVDEVRISNIPRTASWIKASYNSENNSLLTYGSEEQGQYIDPAFSNIGYNATHAGETVKFYVKWNSPSGLDKCIFSTNNTGIWQNQSVAVSGTTSWANVTQTLNIVVGTVVGFRWYCNNTIGSMADTGMRTLTTLGNEQPPNNPPNKPFNPSPVNGAIGIPISPKLSVNVTDPNADAMNVSFYQPPPPENFTIVALPDTQSYCKSYPFIFTNQTRWIVNNALNLNIVFVTHEGDIVDTATDRTQWNYANTSMSILDNNVPWGILPGNHDIAGSDLTNYNTYFGYARFSGKSWYGGAYLDTNTNSYQLFSGGFEDYLIFHIQYEPSDAILAWANTIIGLYPNRRVIVTTHDYLTANGIRSVNGEKIWQKLIMLHADQIFLVLCGHAQAEAMQTDTVNGHIVYQLMADYQNRENGGNGWLRLLEFHSAEAKIYVKTYSTYLKTYETDSNSQFTLDYNMTAGLAPKLIGVAYNIPSGTSASVIWSGLTYTTTYQWYTVAVDSRGAIAQSNLWSFTTVKPQSKLFSDGFEGGNFNAWTVTTIDSSDTLTVVSTDSPHHGTYQAKMVIGSVADGETCVYKTLPTTYGLLYARAYIKFSDASLTTFDANGDYICLLCLTSTSGGNILRFQLRRNSGAVKWCLEYRNSGDWQQAYSTTPSISTNTFYCIEIKQITGASGEARAWIDGVEKITVTGIDNDDRGTPNQIKLFGYRQVATAVSVWGDCLVTDSSPIGVEVS